MKVLNHNKFRFFDYENEPCPTFQLGDILFKDYHSEDEKPEIGVVIQTFSDGDVRTDMWGMCHLSEVSLAHLDDINMYRPKLLPDLIVD